MFLAHFSGVFEQMEDKFLDFRFRYFNQHLEVDKDLVFIDVDEYSLGVMSSLYGGWPWPRASVFGQMVDYMMGGNPSAVLSMFCLRSFHLNDWTKRLIWKTVTLRR